MKYICWPLQGKDIYISDFQDVGPDQWPQAPPGNDLEMQLAGTTSDLMNQKFWGTAL